MVGLFWRLRWQLGVLAMVLTKTLPARIYADLEIVRKIMNWRDATVYTQRNAYPVEQNRLCWSSGNDYSKHGNIIGKFYIVESERGLV